MQDNFLGHTESCNEMARASTYNDWHNDDEFEEKESFHQWKSYAGWDNHFM